MNQESKIGNDERRNQMDKERTNLALERNKFANQRTFLSWIRTGLACVGGGIALIRLLTFHQTAHKIIAEMCGEVLIFLGIAMFMIAFLGYRKSTLELSQKGSSTGSLIAFASISLILIALSILLLWIT